LEQIQNVGDWVEYTNLGKSLIIVRTKDGVKALDNACRIVACNSPPLAGIARHRGLSAHSE
jgi:hypothetical protein